LWCSQHQNSGRQMTHFNQYWNFTPPESAGGENAAQDNQTANPHDSNERQSAELDPRELQTEVQISTPCADFPPLNVVGECLPLPPDFGARLLACYKPALARIEARRRAEREKADGAA